MDEKQLAQFYESVKTHLTFFNDVTDNATGEDTIALINQAINKYSHSAFIKYCVSVIDSISKNDFEFCENLFKIACALVKYRRDPSGHEMVWSPLLLIKVRNGDCKKFTTFICAILKCKGINSASKVVNYDSEFGWQHIFAIAFLPGRQKYLVLDPVNHCKFDAEVEHRVGRVNFYDGSKSKLTMTKLSMMGDAPQKNQKFLGLGSYGNAADDVLGDLDDISGRQHGRKVFRQMHEAEQMYIHGMGDIIDGEYEEMSGIDDGIGAPKIIKKVAQKVQQTKQKVQQKAQAVKQNQQQKKEVRKAAAPAKKAARQEKRAKIAKKLKSVGFGPTRAAFLALIAAGGALAKHTPIKFNLAVKIAELWQKDGGKSMTEIWQKFGGKRESLKKAIIKASKIQISGIGEAASATVIVASVVAAAPILGFVIKSLKDKGVVSEADASNAADLVENLEDANTNVNGDMNPDLVTAAKNAGAFIEDAIKTDDGGDKQAQKIIQTTPTPNDQTPTPTPAAQTPQAFSDNSQSSSSSSDQQARTTESSSSDSTATTTPNAGGFILTNASSWLTGSGVSQLGFNNMFPGHETITMIIGSLMFLTSMYLFYSKTKTIKP